MRRPQPNLHSKKVPSRLAEAPTAQALAKYAKHAEYIGSGEHKSAPWHGVSPFSRKRKDANRCPSHLTKDQANDMLKTGILAGNISEEFEGELPKRVWYNGKLGIFEARLTDRADIASGKPAGYKGWPEEKEKLPSKPRDIRVTDET